MEGYSPYFYLGIYDDAREQRGFHQDPDSKPATDALRTAANMAASGRQGVADFLETTGFQVTEAKQYEAELDEVSELPINMMRALALVAKQERWKRNGRNNSELAPVEQALIDHANTLYQLVQAASEAQSLSS